jgi:4-hydroxybenzoate polyprenyltransferase
LLVVCVVAARTAAMAFNRLVDARIDAANPRTAEREIPRGAVSPREAALLVVLSALAFVAAAGLLGIHCLVLTPPVLLVLLGYSYAKRYTSLCHVVLGIALALAPGGVWYALTAEWSPAPLPLMGAVLAWVAGFDILYSCQDEAFDRAHGLRSVPQTLGVANARLLAFLLHVASVALLLVTGAVFSCGPVYYVAVAAFGAVVASQHLAVAKRGISCIDQVFFTRNGVASIGFLLLVLIDTSLS